MADAVKRGVLLKGLAPVAEVQKHVVKDSARLNSYVQMRAQVVDLLRAEAALQVPMDVDGACWSGPKGKEKMKDKGKGKTDDPEGKGKARARQRAKARKVKKPESATSATSLGICERTAVCTRNALLRKSRDTSCSARSDGRNVGVH